MKNLFKSLMLVIALVSFSATTSFAIEKPKSINLYRDVMVNGTLVKKGDYKVKFDSTANEVWIMAGKKVVAKAPAKLVDREKPRVDELGFLQENGNLTLKRLSFAKEDKSIVLETNETNETNNASLTNPQ